MAFVIKESNNIGATRKKNVDSNETNRHRYREAYFKSFIQFTVSCNRFLSKRDCFRSFKLHTYVYCKYTSFFLCIIGIISALISTGHWISWYRLYHRILRTKIFIFSKGSRAFITIVCLSYRLYTCIMKSLFFLSSISQLEHLHTYINIPSYDRGRLFRPQL